jgi:hypothetical protein
MNQAIYKLSRLVENEDNLHKVIPTGDPGQQMNIEVMAEIPFHLKLECTDKMESPILLNLADIKTGVMKHLEIYCSFSNKEPSLAKCDFEASNQEEIRI